MENVAPCAECAPLTLWMGLSCSGGADLFPIQRHKEGSPVASLRTCWGQLLLLDNGQGGEREFPPASEDPSAPE